MKIYENKIQCKKCGQELISRSVHDFQVCYCGAVSVDGGLEYLRRGGKKENIIELSTYSKDEEEKL